MKMTFTLYWTREDHQGSYSMGNYETKAQAEADIPNALAELLGQCPGPVGGIEYAKCAAEIHAGSWSINET